MAQLRAKVSARKTPTCLQFGRVGWVLSGLLLDADIMLPRRLWCEYAEGSIAWDGDGGHHRLDGMAPSQWHRMGGVGLVHSSQRGLSKEDTEGAREWDMHAVGPPLPQGYLHPGCEPKVLRVRSDLEGAPFWRGLGPDKVYAATIWVTGCVRTWVALWREDLTATCVQHDLTDEWIA